MLNIKQIDKQVAWSIAVFIAIAIGTIFIAPKINAVLLNSASIIGSVASVIGLIHVWLQVTKAISISNASKNAAENARDKVMAFISIVDLTKLLKTIQETQKYNRHKEFSLSHLRMQELREGLQIIRSNPKYSSVISDKKMSGMISMMSTDICSLDKQLVSKGEQIDISILNNNLDSILKELDVLNSKLRFQEEQI